MYLALISYLPPLNLPLFPSFLISPLFLASFLCLRHSHLSFLCISHTNLQTTVWVCSLGLKERGFNTLPTCVCVYTQVYVSSFVHACMHTLLLVWNREILVWIYMRIQWCGVEFSFLLLQKKNTAARQRQGKFVFLFRAHPNPPNTE